MLQNNKKKNFSSMEGLQKIELKVQIAGEIECIKDKLTHFIYGQSKEA